MAISEDTQAIIDAINSANAAASTVITNAISAQTTDINAKLDAIAAGINTTNSKLDTVITHARNIDSDLDTVIDKENRVIHGMGLQGRALNASVSYKIKDPNGEQILEDLDNLNS